MAINSPSVGSDASGVAKQGLLLEEEQRGSTERVP